MPGDWDHPKVVGRRRCPAPAEALAQSDALRRFAEARAAFPKPRGFVFRARSWEDYAAWRRRQPNPRLW